MGKYLNNNNSDFIEILKSNNYIDKTNLIKATNSNLNTAYDKYMCVTRPEEFGKTSIISMLNAYYSKGADSKDIFKNLKISKDEKYLQNLNKYNVIKFDVLDFYLRYKDNFIDGLEKELIEELKEEYRDILGIHDKTIADILIRVSDFTNEKFIFLIDNWDIIMLKEPKSKLVDKYILFLTAIFRGTDIHCVIDLAYLTGIIPIKLYSILLTRLDIFKIYSMIGIYYLNENCDFTKDDVKEL